MIMKPGGEMKVLFSKREFRRLESCFWARVLFMGLLYLAGVFRSWCENRV